MSNRKETPAYASPSLEPFIADRAMIRQKLSEEIKNLSPREVDNLIATKVLSLDIRKSYFKSLTDDTSIVQRRVLAVVSLSEDLAKSLEEKESRRRTHMLSDSGEREAIAIGPNDVVPENPANMRAFGEIELGADPDETIPAPAFPTPITPPDPIHKEALEAKAKAYVDNESKKTITLPPRFLDPLMPPVAKKTYPESTPIEFLPRRLTPGTSYSFILEFQTERRKEEKKLKQWAEKLELEMSKKGKDKR